MSDDWSLEGKEISDDSLQGWRPLKDVEFFWYKDAYIEILRKKLIEDFAKYDKEYHWAYGEFTRGAKRIINKRFGVDE